MRVDLASGVGNLQRDNVVLALVGLVGKGGFKDYCEKVHVLGTHLALVKSDVLVLTLSSSDVSALLFFVLCLHSFDYNFVSEPANLY